MLLNCHFPDRLFLHSGIYTIPDETAQLIYINSIVIVAVLLTIYSYITENLTGFSNIAAHAYVFLRGL